MLRGILKPPFTHQYNFDYCLDMAVNRDGSRVAVCYTGPESQLAVFDGRRFDHPLFAVARPEFCGCVFSEEQPSLLWAWDGKGLFSAWGEGGAPQREVQTSNGVCRARALGEGSLVVRGERTVERVTEASGQAEVLATLKAPMQLVDISLDGSRALGLWGTPQKLSLFDTWRRPGCAAALPSDDVSSHGGAVSPDGRVAVFCGRGRDSLFRYCRVADDLKSVAVSRDIGTSYLGSVEFTPSGTQFAYNGGPPHRWKCQESYIWDVAAWSAAATMSPPWCGVVSHFRFSRDGATLATTYHLSEVALWEC